MLVPRRSERVQVLAEGRGEPAIVLTSGMGGAHYDWSLVVPGLRTQHCVVRFDRPGLGGSPARRDLPTLAEETDRLADVIDTHAGSSAVVVAHSCAALHAESLGRRYPELLAGLVLVDPSFGAGRRLNKRALAWADRVGRAALARAHRVGLVSVGGPLVWSLAARTSCSEKVPQQVRSAGREAFGSVQALGATWQEYLAFRGMLADLWALRHGSSFPAVPAWVLTATGEMRTGPAAWWLRGHEELVAMLNACHRVLPAAGHQIAWEAPGVVIAAIKDVAGRLV